MPPLKVFLAPVGCPKANIDLEKLAWLLVEHDYLICTDPSEASAAIVFGCGFIDDAKRETIDILLELADLKRRGTLDHLLMIGCLPQKYGPELCEDLPEVDAFVGNSSLGAVPSILAGLTGAGPARRLWTEPSFEPWAGPRRYRTSSASPWTRTVMICDGCDNGCTYCSIPHMRGPLRSRPADRILSEVALLVEEGAREIILAGQDTASYGRDKGEAGLGGLMAAVAERNPEQWIRLSYVHPDNLDLALADVFNQYGNVCNYLDMPIQHASARVLAGMGRRDDPAALRAKIDRLRAAVPDIALRTSVVVGFPGEQERDFDLLVEFLSEVRFDLVGVFAFSAQSGTPAAVMPGRVDEETKQARLIEIVTLQEQISAAKMRGLVGSTLRVLVEGVDETGRKLSRSQYDMPEIDRIIRLSDCTALPGRFTRARIEGVTTPCEWSGSELRGI